MIWLYVKKYHKIRLLAFLRRIGRRHVLMFVTKNRQKLHCYEQIAGSDVFEVWGRCSLRVMTPDEICSCWILMKSKNVFIMFSSRIVLISDGEVGHSGCDVGQKVSLKCTVISKNQIFTIDPFTKRHKLVHNGGFKNLNYFIVAKIL